MPDGEVMMADLGLVLGVAMSGEGEGEPLSKGLLRHRALPPVVDITARVSLHGFQIAHTRMMLSKVVKGAVWRHDQVCKLERCRC